MQRLDLTHVGTFSERAEHLLGAILQSKGNGELGTGIGLLPQGDSLGIMVSFNDDIITIFKPKEARALIEIITDTNAEEEPYTRKVGAILDQLVRDLQDLTEEAEEYERDMVIKH